MENSTGKKSHTLRMILIFLVIAALVLWFFSKQFQGLPKGAKPELPSALTTIEGSVVDVAALKGKPIVVNFWATWCPPCVLETPNLVRASKTYAGRVNFIGFAVDSELGQIREFQAKFQISYFIVPAPMTLLRDWKAEQLPTTYLLDSSGAVVWSHVGYVSESDLTKAIENILNVKKVQS